MQFLKAVVGPLVFIEQLTSKDTATINSQTTWLAKFQVLSNVVTGRIFGINFFGNVTKFPQTMNPAGMLNKWTYLGAGMIAYSELGRRLLPGILPKTGLVGSYGKRILPAALAGGFFDAPDYSVAGTGNTFSQPQYGGQNGQDVQVSALP